MTLLNKKKSNVYQLQLELILERKYCAYKMMNLPSETTTDMNVLGTRNPDNVLDWLPQRDPQVQILNFLDSNGLLPMRFVFVKTHTERNQLLKWYVVFDIHLSTGIRISAWIT